MSLIQTQNLVRWMMILIMTAAKNRISVTSHIIMISSNFCFLFFNFDPNYCLVHVFPKLIA